MAKDEKICPLSYASGKGAYDKEVSSFDYCSKEECERWFGGEGCCSLVVIASALNHISNHPKFQ